jgi:hypothetical protein
MCEQILQLYSSQYSSESLAIKILLSTTGLFSVLKVNKSMRCANRCITPTPLLNSISLILDIEVRETAGDGRRRAGDESESSTPSFLREGDAGGPPPARKRVRPARQDAQPDLSVELPVTPTVDTGRAFGNFLAV